MMYDELIKALHEGAEFLECSTPGIKNSFAKMCHNAADAIEELLSERDEVNVNSWKTAFEIERDEHRWIPVTEQPPLKVGDEGYTGYLVFANGHYEIADYTTGKFDNVPYFHVDGEYEPDVTHWIELPAPPMEDENNV